MDGAFPYLFRLDTCFPTCDGKICGDDGCGGTCGSCLDGQTCSPTGKCDGGCTGDFIVSGAESGAVLDELFTCDWIDGNLTVTECPLNDLNALSGLEGLTGDLDISNNDNLSDISGLQALTEVGGSVRIAYNTSLGSTSGLKNVSTIGTFLTIQNNPALVELGLTGLQSINGALTIVDNDMLCDTLINEFLAGGVTYLSHTINNNNSECSTLGGGVCPGDYTINGFDPLSDLVSLGLCTTITGKLEIKDTNLTGLTGLEWLQEIEGDLHIEANPLLQDLNGLVSLTHVGGRLDIKNADALITLAGLGELDTVGGELNIEQNPVLESLELDSLTTVGQLRIVGNEMLCQESTDALVEQLELETEPEIGENGFMCGTGMP
jgi:hypothetical protein